LLGTAVSFFSPVLIEQAAVAANRVPSGNRSQTSAPSDIFATTDGHVLLHVVGNGIFRRLSTAIARDDWIDDPELQSDEDRGLARDRICGHLIDWCASKSTTEVLDVMASAGVPCGPVLAPQAVLQHSQIEAMEFFKNVPMPGMAEGVTVADFPVSMSGAEVGLRQGSASVGEHAEEILAELGYNAAEIAELRSVGAI